MTGPQADDGRTLLGVYGTLRRDQVAGAHVRAHGRHVADGRLLGCRLVNSALPDGAPYVYNDAPGMSVVAEVYAVDDAFLAFLDRYEGCPAGAPHDRMTRTLQLFEPDSGAGATMDVYAYTTVADYPIARPVLVVESGDYADVPVTRRRWSP